STSTTSVAKWPWWCGTSTTRSRVSPSWGCPRFWKKLVMLDRGLILVVGAAGSGKSTTLASMLDYRTANRAGHIVCIEDPIEFLHRHQKAIIDQREVGLDTMSF